MMELPSALKTTLPWGREAQHGFNDEHDYDQDPTACHAMLCHVHAMSSAHLLVDCPAYRRELEVALHHWGGHRGELAGAGPGLDVRMR